MVSMVSPDFLQMKDVAVLLARLDRLERLDRLKHLGFLVTENASMNGCLRAVPQSL